MKWILTYSSRWRQEWGFSINVRRKALNSSPHGRQLEGLWWESPHQFSFPHHQSRFWVIFNYWWDSILLWIGLTVVHASIGDLNLVSLPVGLKSCYSTQTPFVVQNLQNICIKHRYGGVTPLGGGVPSTDRGSKIGIFLHVFGAKVICKIKVQ